MGPKLLPTDLIRPPRTDRPPPAAIREDDGGESFIEHLQQARSKGDAQATSDPPKSGEQSQPPSSDVSPPPATDAKPPPSRPRKKDQDDAQPTAAETSNDSTPNAESDTQIIQADVGIVTVAHLPEPLPAGADADDAPIVQSAAPAHPDKPASSATSSHEPTLPDAPTTGIESPPESSLPPDVAGQSSRPGAGPELPVNTAALGEKPKSSDNVPKAEASPDGSDRRSQRVVTENKPVDTVRHPHVGNRPSISPIDADGRPTEHFTGPISGGVARGLKEEHGPRRVAESEGVRPKIEPALTDEHASEDPQPNSKSTERHGVATEKANRFRAIADGPEAMAAVKSASVRTGTGDSAAAAIGKFLIDSTLTEPAPHAQRDGATPNDLPRPAEPTVADRGSPSVGFRGQPAANTVGQLLTSGTASGDGVEQAARVLNASGGQGRYQVTLQLDPPSLGELKVEVHMQQQAMTLRVDAQTQAVAKLIESRMPELRDSLAAHGIRVEQSDIVIRSPETGHSNPSHQEGAGDRREDGSMWSNRDGGAWLHDGGRAGAGRDDNGGSEGWSGLAGGEGPGASVSATAEEMAAMEGVSREGWALDLVA